MTLLDPKLPLIGGRRDTTTGMPIAVNRFYDLDC